MTNPTSAPPIVPSALQRVAAVIERFDPTSRPTSLCTEYLAATVSEAFLDGWNAALAAQQPHDRKEVVSHTRQPEQSIRQEAPDPAPNKTLPPSITGGGTPPPADAERLAKLRAGRLSPRWLDDIEFLLRQIEERDAEIKRLNEWADGFSDAQLKERRLCEELLRERDAKYQDDHKQLCDVMYRERDALRATIAEQARRLEQLNGVLAEIADMEGREGLTDYTFTEKTLGLVNEALRPTPATSRETPPSPADLRRADEDATRNAFAQSMARERTTQPPVASRETPPVPFGSGAQSVAETGAPTRKCADTTAGALPSTSSALQPPADLVERAREVISEWLEHDLSSWLDTELAELRELIAAALAAERAEARAPRRAGGDRDGGARSRR